jgi:hypothetical protein
VGAAAEGDPDARDIAGGLAGDPGYYPGGDADGPAVADLSPGSWGGVVSYLPGRQLAEIRVASDHVLISVRGR